MHAKNHSYFVANSELVNASSGMKSLHSISPTSRNLSVLLRLLTNLCSELKDCRAETVTKILVLQWSTDLVTTCKPCTSQLSKAQVFKLFILLPGHFLTYNLNIFDLKTSILTN